MRASLDDVGMRIAVAWSKRATCPRRSVGCVLFDSSGHQLSSGYNGPASGQPHCIDHPCPGATLPSGTGLSKCEAIHAEANALLRCSDVTKVHTAYVTTSPCLDCVKLLLNTGCRRIVFLEEYAHGADAKARWLRTNGPFPCLGCQMTATCRDVQFCYDMPRREWVLYQGDLTR